MFCSRFNIYDVAILGDCFLLDGHSSQFSSIMFPPNLTLDKRDNLPQLIDQLGLKFGVEVGVSVGEFSHHLLKNSHLDILYGVDAWSTDEIETRSALKKVDKKQSKFDEHYEIAQKTLGIFGGRSKLIRALSWEGAKQFADGCLDFIYIDASHRFSGVALDLINWWPKLRVGGIFAGHDYWYRYRYEVVNAVNGFVTEMEQYLNVTPNDRHHPIYPPTWWLVKSPMSKTEFFAGLPECVAKLRDVQQHLAKRKIRIALPYNANAVVEVTNNAEAMVCEDVG